MYIPLVFKDTGDEKCERFYNNCFATLYMRQSRNNNGKIATTNENTEKWTQKCLHPLAPSPPLWGTV